MKTNDQLLFDVYVASGPINMTWSEIVVYRRRPILASTGASEHRANGDDYQNKQPRPGARTAVQILKVSRPL
jgi:hypothetical protein